MSDSGKRPVTFSSSEQLALRDRAEAFLEPMLLMASADAHASRRELLLLSDTIARRFFVWRRLGALVERRRLGAGVGGHRRGPGEVVGEGRAVERGGERLIGSWGCSIQSLSVS